MSNMLFYWEHAERDCEVMFYDNGTLEIGGGSSADLNENEVRSLYFAMQHHFEQGVVEEEAGFAVVYDRLDGEDIGYVGFDGEEDGLYLTTLFNSLDCLLPNLAKANDILNMAHSTYKNTTNNMWANTVAFDSFRIVTVRNKFMPIGHKEVAMAALSKLSLAEVEAIKKMFAEER